MAGELNSRATRRRVRDRANNLCEYCRHPGAYSNAPYVCEHIWPRIRGSGSSLDDLAWACPACNGHKHAKTHAIDPKTGRLVALFNPRRQRWSRHFAWSNDLLLMRGRTAIGRATVIALHLNRPERINLRYVLRAAGVHPT